MSVVTTEGVDFTQIPGLDHHRTAVTFNCLILKMTELLNNFGNRMEDVLEKAEKSLDLADRKLRLMEAKLADVHLDDDDMQKRPTTSSELVQPPVVALTAPESSSKEPEAVESPAPKSEDVPGPSDPASSSQVILIKDDPVYSKYFKMLKMGVPEAGVIQKMSSEGVDPSFLQRGDEPSRLQDQKTLDYESSGESVSSFSDSD